ncbi:hypothetical protein ACLB2K_006908 [Fragaria x ananassa]
METLLKALETLKTDIVTSVNKRIDGVKEKNDALSRYLGGRIDEAELRLDKHVSHIGDLERGPNKEKGKAKEHEVSDPEEINLDLVHKASSKVSSGLGNHGKHVQDYFWYCGTRDRLVIVSFYVLATHMESLVEYLKRFKIQQAKYKPPISDKDAIRIAIKGLEQRQGTKHHDMHFSTMADLMNKVGSYQILLNEFDETTNSSRTNVSYIPPMYHDDFSCDNEEEVAAAEIAGSLG